MKTPPTHTREVTPFNIPEKYKISNDLGINLASYIENLIRDSKGIEDTVVRFHNIRTLQDGEAVQRQSFNVRQYASPRTNNSTFTVRRIRENSPQVNITITEESTLNEVCEAFQGFLLALGFSFPEGASLGFEYDDEPSGEEFP